MCGIAGFVGTPDATVLDRMADVVRHRGPDDAGSFSEGIVSLAQRRLSILDVAGGHQPMPNADGSLVLVFNGEIYNHPELKQRLEGLGYRYATRSDSETILHAYEEYGRNCVDHLDGMFAFVIYDRRRRLLFGARDRMGKKPLYYTERPFDPLHFAFASELKSLQAHPLIAPRLKPSLDGIVSYLLNDYVQGARCIYEGVGRLEPGCAFEYKLPGAAGQGFRTWRYWRLTVGSTPGSDNPAPPSESHIESRLIDLLHQSVQRRLMSDVPVGVLLSGGLDSSTIVALLHRIGHAPLKTFSIGFRDTSFDESPHAAAVAQHFRTQHVTRTFAASDLIEQIPRVAGMLDEPLADPSIFPTAMLSELAAEHVKVVLGGDGADELFAGYDPFKALAAAKWYSRLVPRFLHRSTIAPLAGMLPDSSCNMSLAFKAARFLRGVHVPSDRRVAVWMGAFSPRQLQRLLPDSKSLFSQDALLAHYGLPVDAPVRGPADDVERALQFYQRCYLPDDILVKIDRASMLHSLEVRAPFLDTQLVQFVNRLPSRFKFRHGTTKYILRQAVLNGRLLPESIVRRKKKGFGIPIARWMRSELGPYFRFFLVDEWPASLDMFDRTEIRRLWDRHVQGFGNYYKELWALFMLSQWATHFLQRPTRFLAPTSDTPASLNLKPHIVCDSKRPQTLSNPGASD